MAGQKFPFSATFVYGRNTMEERKILWQRLPKLSAAAWVILGDFNAIFTAKDRNGGKPVSKAELLDSSQWLARTQMDALKQTGSFFTWTNNQDGRARIYSKIDHVFANEDWVDLFPNTTTVFNWETVSDHCSCTLSIQGMENLGVKLFRFYNFWADHKDFKEVALDSWRKPIQGTGLKAIYLKTMRLKHKLKRFNRDHIGDIGVQFHKAKDDFQAALFHAQQHPSDFTLQDNVKVAADAFIIQEQMYHSFLAQRSKINWLGKGDSNTAYFHACLKKCKEENRIASYVTEQGRVVDNFSEVVSHFLNHFRSIMGGPSSVTKKLNIHCVEMGSKLSVDQQLSLLKPFSHREIRNSLFSIRIIKSPGPDGFGSGFFKVLWLDIGDEICRAVGQFFESGSIPEDLLNTTLSLVPKIDNPSRAVEYRPIACCSTIYKYDLLLFCKGSLAAVQVLKGTLEEFSYVTGLQINASKSHVYFGGVSVADRQILAAELQLSEGSFPLKYLGVPMRPTKWKHEDCDIIIQKFRMRLHTWASRHLSFAGRIQLIHSVLFGLRNYWMSIFILPQSIIKEIEKLCRGFLWGVNGNRSKIHMASWSKVCMPKVYGGLGFRNGSVWNRAIFAKYVWAITEKHDVLWVKWINSIYLKGSDFWSYRLPPDTSWYWRKLCNLRGHFSCDEVKVAGSSGKIHPSKLYNSSLCQQQVDYHRAVWCRMSIPKHRFLLWQTVNSQLLTCDNLLRLCLALDSLLCPVCGISAENHAHLFFDCYLSKQILVIIFGWLGFQAWPSEFTSWLVWLSSRNPGIIFAIINSVLAAVVYSIWRN
ncbi:uncharacterized protein LOC133800051 [Humulus lupulus]|uniref:uncharacterized protein LOC133800051 n=1 Tax=Humulus lupulus TaxID=3486 RepID=UPI002B407D5D|nr:uncharacterized protein LOC133800051 [Humulus lupulus]